LMIWTNEKGKRAVEVTDPDLCGAGVEIEEPFFGDFACGIGRGDNLNADLWSALGIGENLRPSCQVEAVLRLKLRKLDGDWHKGIIRWKW